MATTSATTGTTGNGATFQFTGSISGLDTASIIQAMLSVEKAPLNTISTKRTSLQAQQAAYDKLRTLLGTFQTKLQQFTVWNQGAARSASSSNTSVLTASSGTGVTPGSYQVVVGRLATSTVATSSAALATQLSDATAGATALSDLPLAGTLKGGTMSLVVDGSILQVTIDTTKTLSQTLADIATVVGTKIAATDGGATVTASADGNRVTLSVAGAASNHSVSFGAGGDTSNAASLFGLTGASSSTFGVGATSLAATSSLGVVRTSAKLDLAGVAGLAALGGTAYTGTMTVNGAAIAYDTSKDSLTDIITRINNSTAGVVASLDRGNDTLVLTAKTGGSTPIAMTDTGVLAGVLNLSTGSTAGQTLGLQAQYTVDGRSYTSNTNIVSDAIDGVKLNFLALGSSTVTVSPDTTATTTAAQGLVDSYNALADALDQMTANGVNQEKGPLATDSSVRNMAMSFRRTLTGLVAGGKLTSLAEVGITTGAAGSKVGTTSRLQLDTAKLSSAIASDTGAVSSLFSSLTGSLVASVKSWTSFGGNLDTATKSITSQLTTLAAQEATVNERVRVRQAALEAQFSKMESLLARMQTTTNSLNNTIAQQNKSTG